MTDNMSDASACRELDRVFVEVLRGMNQSVVDTAEMASSTILKSAEQFLNKRAQDAVRNFHSLYFGAAGVEESKSAVNKDVDDMIEQLRAEMESGVGADALGQTVTEKESLRGMRLGLSGIQKELEAIITLESGIREKLMPVLWGMQFEDMIRQRLGHVSAAWELVMGQLAEKPYLDVAPLGERIAELMTSQAEREIYFRTVLRREPPAGAAEETSILFDLG